MPDSIPFHGPVFHPGEPGYDDERLGYNLEVDHRPAIIVGATGAADVVAAVRHAREHRIAVAVQCTGHGASIPADGALLITTRRMTGVHIDPQQRTARIAAGVTSGLLVHEAAAFGLAPLAGTSADVGVVAYTLGGGIPVIGRRFGQAADHVRELDVVTADGELRTVAPDREPELFWALRGGKGNFGVVVSMVVELFEVARLLGGAMYFDGPLMPRLLQTYRTWCEQVPDAMASSVVMLRLPDLPVVPEPVRGRRVAAVRVAFCGDPAEGERWVERLRAVGPRLVDTVFDMPYRDIATITRDPSGPGHFFARGSMLRALEPATVDALLEHVAPPADPPYFVELRHFGGALSRPATIPSAAGRRDGLFSVYSGSVVQPGGLDALRAEHDALHVALARWSSGGRCANYLSGPHVTADELASAYLPEDFARLREIKTRWDPDNMFRINHSIAPA